MYISESSRAPPLRSSFLSRPICKLRINHYICIGVRGDSSELPLFYSSSKASGTSPECSRQKPIGRISGPLQSSKTIIAMFPSDLHPINSQLSGIPIFTSNRRFIAICFFEYIVGSNYPERGLSTSDVLVYLYPG